MKLWRVALWSLWHSSECELMARGSNLAKLVILSHPCQRLKLRYKTIPPKNVAYFHQHNLPSFLLLLLLYFPSWCDLLVVRYLFGHFQTCSSQDTTITQGSRISMIRTGFGLPGLPFQPRPDLLPDLLCVQPGRGSRSNKTESGPDLL